MQGWLVWRRSAGVHTRHLLIFYTSIAFYFIPTNSTIYCAAYIYFQGKSGLSVPWLSWVFLKNIHFHVNLTVILYFLCRDVFFLNFLLPPVEHCQTPWILKSHSHFVNAMKCPRSGWSPAFWRQILCVSSFREYTDIPAMGRLCHSESVWRFCRSSFFPLSPPWRATTGPECHRENERWMKIDAAFGFQEAWLTHLWAVDTIIPPVTLDRGGHWRAVMALVTLGQPEESWSCFLLFLADTMWIELVALSKDRVQSTMLVGGLVWEKRRCCHCNFTTQPWSGETSFFHFWFFFFFFW